MTISWATTVRTQMVVPLGPCIIQPIFGTVKGVLHDHQGFWFSHRLIYNSSVQILPPRCVNVID